MRTATIHFDKFNALADKEAGERIRAARAKLGDDVELLCHHYQRADVFQHADITGDSLKLSRLAGQFGQPAEGMGIHRIGDRSGEYKAGALDAWTANSIQGE